MSDKKNRREKCNLIKKSRWAGYAAAGAATAVVGHETADAALTVKDPVDTTLNAAITTTTLSSVGYFDLNMDGVSDVAFVHLGVILPPTVTTFGAPTGGGTEIGAAFAFPLSNTFGSNNAVGGFIGPTLSTVDGGTVAYPYVYNMPIGAPISASTPNFITGGTLAFVDGFGFSQFVDAGDGYVSVRFDSAAGTHYGWIRVEMSGTPLNSLTIEKWAYGMPDEPVLTGVPEAGSLGMMAFGATGLMAWRRRRGQAALERARQENDD